MSISFVFAEVAYFIFFSVNNNGLRLIRVYNHHIFFEPLHSISSSFKGFSVHEIVLSLAKLCNWVFSIQRKISLMKMLKRMGPKIDSCATPANKT